ncbi:metal-dependent hydrolase [Halorussus halophilus]|uniref:metal-dependent hydrolase n=1 Tax=Halorussus halophilus TaxID=2650975 RepID=UPI00130183B3|nr:metal-dependent hydrolase [Halorussus halophilus]
MMVGHAMLAFAVAATLGTRLGYSNDRALALGVVAGAFAAVPDVDMVYAFVGVAKVGFGGVWQMTNAFWGSSTVVHRAVTHSLVVGAIAAVAFAFSPVERGRPIAAILLASLVAVAFFESGLLGATVMFAFVFAGVVVSLLAIEFADAGPRAMLATALVGLLSHPFGDLFTGTPPQFFYPFEWALFADRLALLADPTLNLLAIFLLELSTIWLAGSVYLRLTDQRLATHVDTRAAGGVAYAIAAVVLPAPTLDVSYHFVFSVLAVGVVGVAPRFHPAARPVLSADWNDALTWSLTGLAAVSFATVAYTAVYLLM